MRKRSGQVHSRESSATLQLTVSLLYRIRKSTLQNGKKFSIIGTKTKNSQLKGRSNAAFLRYVS